MKPPYEITPAILRLITQIAEQIGAASAHLLDNASPQLRKKNQIKTIHASLQIEGNTLSEEQITALLENKIVVGPPKDIAEVQNAIAVYNQLGKYNPQSMTSLLEAHNDLMPGLLSDAGRFRTKAVGIVHGNNVQHIAPPAANVPTLMHELFNYVKNSEDPSLVKSCVFHYELEFIHPFSDGNGRMGRLWQTLLLQEEYPLFAHLPFETLISQTQAQYYEALAASDKAGNSTLFITYLLNVLHLALQNLLLTKSNPITSEGRLAYFLTKRTSPFSRKDYMLQFKNISPATASRDLLKGIESGLLLKEGEKNNTVYCPKSN